MIQLLLILIRKSVMMLQRASGAGDEGHTADGGVERPKVVIVDVVGEKAANAKTKFAADQ
jgi:hypothetical protein